MNLREIFMPEREKSAGFPADESARISRPAWLLRLVVVFIGGMGYAAALPPLNWSVLAFVSLLPLILFATAEKPGSAAFAGWLWGLGWSLFAYRFLREIDPAVPWLIAPVISLWPAAWAAVLPWLWRNTMFPLEVEMGGFEKREAWLAAPRSYFRLLAFAVGAAALFTLCEWTRSRLFTWNDFGATQYRNLALLQIARWTGGYGINFLVAFGGTALFACCRTRLRSAGLRVLLTYVCILTLVLLTGTIRLSGISRQEPNWFPTVIQGDLSQRRNAGIAEAEEALEIYLALSRKALKTTPKPELLIWPESAVPVPFRSAHPVSGAFRRGVQQLIAAGSVPMLIGAIDFEDVLPESGRIPGVTNSALFFNHRGRIRHKYDKIHRVPFGEYIPFRRYLPDFVTRAIDMNRDLVPGTDSNPIEVAPQVRAGTAICYEGVFSYLTREFARRGANVLVVLSNDAWYPESSEPEQHLANAVTRAVETGLPMVRCGNNGGSLLVTPEGRITQVLEVPGPEKRLELRRGRGFRRLEVAVKPVPEETFFVRYGEWFPGLLAIIAGIWALAGALHWRNRRQFYLDTLDHPKQESGS